MSIKQIENWFRVAEPDGGNELKHFRSQLGVHFEEVSEMLETIQGTNEASNQKIKAAHEAMKALADGFKSGELSALVEDPKELLDSLCDQIVTAVGVGYVAGLNVPAAAQMVADSNDSKFVDGKAIRDPLTQKIKKGPGYWRVDLTNLVKNAKFRL